ncbi:hypothetical protein ACFSL4_04390 [Streptomyces caeni]|uniref:Uncharacterized protein n=1 Tax=Streptomyces caeni TaxID=2307231 RepID=A0ABW4ILS8_9ACTN
MADPVLRALTLTDVVVSVVPRPVSYVSPLGARLPDTAHGSPAGALGRASDA